MIATILMPLRKCTVTCTSCTLLRNLSSLPQFSRYHHYNVQKRKLLDKPAVWFLNRHREVNFKHFSTLRVLFFGTDDFSVESLRTLSFNMKNEKTSQISKLDVVTSAKSKTNPVRKFAMSEQLTIYDWPPQIEHGDYDVGLVVSFGHLIPENIIQSFKFGMLNVHASLLPRWRGAAPIIYAILNGDSNSGVTIMQIAPKKFDIGDILSQSSCDILEHETTTQLSSRLALLGAELMLQSVQNLPHNLLKARKQSEIGVTYAPRVTSALSKVNWQAMDSRRIYNLYRALTGLYPLSTDWHGIPVKLYGASLDSAERRESTEHPEPGVVRLNRARNVLKVCCNDGQWICFSEVGVPGKKPMKPIDFYNGYISKHIETERRFS